MFNCLVLSLFIRVLQIGSQNSLTMKDFHKNWSIYFECVKLKFGLSKKINKPTMQTVRGFSGLVSIETLKKQYFSLYLSISFPSFCLTSSRSSALLCLHPWMSRGRSTTAVNPVRWAHPWATPASAPARLPALPSALIKRTLQAPTTTVSSQVRLMKYAGGRESDYC